MMQKKNTSNKFKAKASILEEFSLNEREIKELTEKNSKDKVFIIKNKK